MHVEMDLEILCEDVTPLWSSFCENIYQRGHFLKYCIILESIASLVSEYFTL